MVTEARHASADPVQYTYNFLAINEQYFNPSHYIEVGHTNG